MRDIDIRRALIEEMEERHSSDDDTLIVQELGLRQGIARVDLAVVNGSMHGYEIKSGRDTLARLASQSEIYGQALEFVSIVAAPHHVARIEADSLISEWWGIWRAEQRGGSVRLEEIRHATRNPGLLSLAVAQFLWRDEALRILDEHSLSSGVRSKSRHHLWDRLACSFTSDQLGYFVRSCLKQRGEVWRGTVQPMSSGG